MLIANDAEACRRGGAGHKQSVQLCSANNATKVLSRDAASLRSVTLPRLLEHGPCIPLSASEAPLFKLSSA